MNDNRQPGMSEYATRDPDNHAVYVIARINEGCLSSPTKVGIARDPKQRLRQLQTGSADRLVLVQTFWFWQRAHAAAVERSVHRALDLYRLEGEWFEVSPVDMSVLVSANVQVFVRTVLRPQTAEEEHMSFDYHGTLAKDVVMEVGETLDFGMKAGAAS